MFDRVVARKGQKQIFSQFDGNEKECVTILPCGNGAGLQLKFLALYAGKVHLLSRLENTHNLCYHGVNSSGYMDEIYFANYIKQEVLPAMTETKVREYLRILSHKITQGVPFLTNGLNLERDLCRWTLLPC